MTSGSDALFLDLPRLPLLLCQALPQPAASLDVKGWALRVADIYNLTELNMWG